MESKESNPYQPPTSAPEDLNPADIPDSISDKIRHAFVTGIVQGCIFILVAVIKGFGAKIWAPSLALAATAAVIFALAFAVRSRSRVAAVILFASSLWSIGAVFAAKDSSNLSSAIIGLLISYFYLEGVIGTFRFHSFRKVVLGDGAV